METPPHAVGAVKIAEHVVTARKHEIHANYWQGNFFLFADDDSL
jgi:hypothetical protein